MAVSNLITIGSSATNAIQTYFRAALQQAHSVLHPIAAASSSRKQPDGDAASATVATVSPTEASDASYTSDHDFDLVRIWYLIVLGGVLSQI